MDMRLRLGLLQDPAVIEKQIAREAAEAQAKKAKAEIPTVKTEAQMKADEVAAAKEKGKVADKAKHKPKIRPLTEAKAIDTGANFISETFIFTVGLTLILAERLYSRSKEQSRQSDVSDRIAELEMADRERNEKLSELNRELAELKAKQGPHWFWQRGQDATEGHSPVPNASSAATSSRKASTPEKSLAKAATTASAVEASVTSSRDPCYLIKT